MMKTISKSRFISGVQCHKKIWFDYFRRDLKLPTDPGTQRIFDLGHEIGRLACNVFPNGKDATPEQFFDLKPAAEKTRQWINENVETIYEATFIAENSSAMLDILHRKDGQLWAIEVKNSTSAKEYHFQDAALQYHVMTKAGFEPDCFFLMYINNQYKRDGEISDDLFTLEDITAQIKAKQQWVSENLEYLLSILQSDVEPEVSIGGHCGSPFTCDYQHHCWSHVPENSVFGLTNGRNKPWDLYNSDILKLDEIPDDYPLSFNQQLQVNGIKNGAGHFDPASIAAFLSTWKQPLHYFDFETINPALPLLNGTRPYQQIPFQYSLHIQNKEGVLSHKEFLAAPEDFMNGSVDPRKQLIEQMKLDFFPEGSIVTYNMPFERRVLTELAKDFPEDAKFLVKLMDRLVDLLPVFRNRWYYTPEMGGSASIKSVLPAIIPTLSYKDLEIKEGGTASDSFLLSILDPENSTSELRNNLLKYCEMDTFAMVGIYNHLGQKMNERQQLIK